jgi:hypothetical protein
MSGLVGHRGLLLGGGGAPTAPTPVLESVATNMFNAGTSDTSCAMTMPSGIVAGELLLHLFTYNNRSPEPVIGAAGWTLVVNLPCDGNRGMSLYKRTATGSDSLTVTNDSGRPSTGITMRISGATNISYSSQSIPTDDFPALTPAEGLQNYLWLVLSGGANQASVAPTDFGTVTTIDSTFGGPKSFKAERAYQGTTLDPGTTNVSQDKLLTVALSG